MVEHLTEEQIAEFKKEFNLFDKDGDGLISVEELGAVMQSFGIKPREAELRELIDGVDTNGNGTVEFDEFVIVMAQTLKDTEHEVLLRNAFSVIDKDHDGFITAIEIHNAMTRLGQKISDEEVVNIIRQVDVDGDGMINYEEFLKLMMK
ncbi:unnamed protein product [Calypogeia fissa]